MKLSVLDQSTASLGKTQDTAIRETLDLARHCESLGYHRFWLSEHHNSGSIVGTAPEILMAAVAATTSRIRIGSAGIMLPHYSALKVAEQFRVLERSGRPGALAQMVRMFLSGSATQVAAIEAASAAGDAEKLRVTGAKTAKEMYGARGWVLHHNTDHWRGTPPINNIDGMWPTGAPWLCHHLWDHYLFTGDREFLAKRAYPAFKESSLFFIDSLVKATIGGREWTALKKL